MASSISELLFNNAEQFEFVQAMRLLENYVAQDKVRISSTPALSFQAHSLIKIKKTDLEPIIQMQVAFMGLVGSNGVLPNHYTELLIQRLQHKDYSLKEFLDIFNHRLITLYYQAEKKYHFYFQCSKRSYFENILNSLVGKQANKKSNIPEEIEFYYGGLFSQKKRSISNLEQILSDYFSFTVAIQQFQSQLLVLNDVNRSTIYKSKANTSQYSQLGKNIILGRFVKDIQNKIRIIIGSLSYQQFKDLLPTGKYLQLLIAIVRRYLGPLIQFDIQLILKKEAVPLCEVSHKGTRALGWDTWLASNKFKKDVSDTILMEQKIWR